MTSCLSHNFPPMYLKRNTTTRLLNLRTLLCMQLLTYETMFEYIVWPIRRTVRRVHCKKRHNFTQRFDSQGHARAQIFTDKDVSVCHLTSPNFHMFYDKRRLSTQISRLCHVHAQVHTLKDMSSHPFLSYGDVAEYSLTLSFPFNSSSAAKELLMSCSL